MTRRNGIVFVLMMVAGIAIFAWSFRDISMDQLMQDLRGANWWWLLVALLAMVIYCAGINCCEGFVDDSNEKLSWPDAIRFLWLNSLGMVSHHLQRVVNPCN